MTVLGKVLQIKSKGEDDIIDLTKQTAKVVLDSKLTDVIVTVFGVGSTAAITTIEFKRGLAKDFPEMLSRVAPKEIYYEHEKMWQDGNGHSSPCIFDWTKFDGSIQRWQSDTWYLATNSLGRNGYSQSRTKGCISDHRGIIRDSYQFAIFQFYSNTAMS